MKYSKSNPKSIKSSEEIEKLAEGGKILAEILRQTADLVKPGVSTFELNLFADKEIRKHGGIPSFIGYGGKRNPFPAALCTSINDVIVHGVPSHQDILNDGDIIGLDIGMIYKGMFTDHAISVPVGNVSPEDTELINAARLALDSAIAAAVIGNTIGDIGYATEQTAKEFGFKVIKDLCGHGVGYAVHEDPLVPGYGKPGKGLTLEANMVLAIEPMLTRGTHHIWMDNDGWTIRTGDGKRSSHFEHTVVITTTGCRILTI